MRITKYLLAITTTIGLAHADNISNQQISYNAGYNLTQNTENSHILGTNQDIDSKEFVKGVKLALSNDTPTLTDEQVKVVSIMMGYMTGMSSVKSTTLLSDTDAKTSYNLKALIQGADDRLDNKKPQYKILNNTELTKEAELANH